MKDYYRILQVHEEAETEVIEVAYRRLMRKYHPDVLPPELRNDPDVLQRAKDINEAFEVLSDPAKRAEYNKAKKKEKLDKNSTSKKHQNNIEQPKLFERYYLNVRCGQTKEEFRALLVREQNANTPFVLIGFETVPTNSTHRKISIFKKISDRITGNNQTSLTKTHNFLSIDSITDEELHGRLNEPPNITMGDIDWGIHTCPVCAGSTPNENGTKATWIGCSNCGHVRCAGGVKETKFGKYSTCPWCGKTNKLTRSVKTGKKDHLPLHGYKKQSQKSQKTGKLEGKTIISELPDGNDTAL